MEQREGTLQPPLLSTRVRLVDGRSDSWNNRKQDIPCRHDHDRNQKPFITDAAGPQSQWNDSRLFDAGVGTELSLALFYALRSGNGFPYMHQDHVLPETRVSDGELRQC
jgi:hypothetical protein